MNETLISSYTRKEAIEDGVLVDLNQWPVTREHYKYPVACTAAVWEIIDKAVKNEKHMNDIEGVLHDILWLSKTCAYRKTVDTVWFMVTIRGAGRKSKFAFKLNVGPGDNAEPVMTLMLPEED